MARAMTDPRARAAAEEQMQQAIANAVQLLIVKPTGKSFQDDADDWAASCMDISAFVETLTQHACAVMADSVEQALVQDRIERHDETVAAIETAVAQARREYQIVGLEAAVQAAVAQAVLERDRQIAALEFTLESEAQAIKEREEFRTKYHDAMAVLSEWGNIDKAEAIARCREQADELTECRARETDTWERVKRLEQEEVPRLQQAVKERDALILKRESEVRVEEKKNIEQAEEIARLRGEAKLWEAYDMRTRYQRDKAEALLREGFCRKCGEAYAPHGGSDPEHRWPY